MVISFFLFLLKIFLHFINISICSDLPICSIIDALKCILDILSENQVIKVRKTENLLSGNRAVKLQEQCQHRIVSEVLDDNKLLDEQAKLSVANQTSKDDNLIEVKMASDDVEYSQTESGDRSHRMDKLDYQHKWKGIDPVLFFKDEAVIKNIVSFFGIEESFSLEGHLVTRSTDNARRMYYVSKSVRDILELNVQVGEQIKIASLGVKMFVSAPTRQILIYFHGKSAYFL